MPSYEPACGADLCSQPTISRLENLPGPTALKRMMASSDRELLLQTEGIQTRRHARRQNRPELPSHDPSHRRHHQLAMNLNRP
jgi:hypothetical protein